MAKQESGESPEKNDYSEMSEIIPGLFLSSIGSLNKKCLQNYQIKTVLSILSNRDPDYEPLSDIKYHFIQLNDEENEDILIHFDCSYDIINKSLSEQKNILVHCVFGVSRSPTLVIAYLMKSQDMPLWAVLSYVKSKRAIIEPNSGFLNQLALYQIANYKISLSNDWIRRYFMHQMTRWFPDGPWVMYYPYLKMFKQWQFDRSMNRSPNLYDFSCKSCKNPLFFHHDVLQKDSVTGSLYISPVKWMFEDDKSHRYFGNPKEPSGKILCPKCQTKLGRFDWREPRLGQQNYPLVNDFTISGDSEPFTMEIEVTFVFAITKSKVDENDDDRYC